MALADGGLADGFAVLAAPVPETGNRAFREERIDYGRLAADDLKQPQ
jgi:hypothetical protein